MAIAKNWTSSSVCPKYTTGGNASQTPKISDGQNPKKSKSAGGKQRLFDPTNFQNNQNCSTTAKYHGWSVTGIKRFNELFDAIGKERLTATGKEFDAELQKYSMEQKEKMKKKQKIESTVFEACRHELWNDNDSAEKGTETNHLVNIETQGVMLIDNNMNCDDQNKDEDDALTRFLSDFDSRKYSV